MKGEGPIWKAPLFFGSIIKATGWSWNMALWCWLSTVFQWPFRGKKGTTTCFLFLYKAWGRQGSYYYWKTAPMDISSNRRHVSQWWVNTGEIPVVWCLICFQLPVLFLRVVCQVSVSDIDNSRRVTFAWFLKKMPHGAQILFPSRDLRHRNFPT